MGLAVNYVDAAAEPIRVVAIDPIRSTEDRQKELIRSTTALAEAALDDLTDEGIEQLAILLKRVKADFDYLRRGRKKGGRTGS